jgi:hypothetical protein
MAAECDAFALHFGAKPRFPGIGRSRRGIERLSMSGGDRPPIRVA